MISMENILKFVEILPDAGTDRPFNGDFFSTVLRIKSDKKWFGVILKASDNYFKSNGLIPPEDKTVLNLKCPPDLSEFLRAQYPRGVLPAYHMNKKLWVSVVLSSGVPEEDIKKLISVSYDAVRKKEDK